MSSSYLVHRIVPFALFAAWWMSPCDAIAAQNNRELVAFAVWETAAGDLNGDGDTDDAVWHVYDARTGVTSNLHLAAAVICTSLSCTPAAPVILHDLVALLISEAGQGTDLNDDADTDDIVMAVYDADTTATTVVPAAVAQAVGRDVSVFRVPLSPVLAGRTAALLVSESGKGGVDLNGDGDQNDAVIELFDVDTGTLVDVGLAAATMPGPFGSQNPLPLDTSGQKVLMVVGEEEQGGTDLNQDGDAIDQIPVAINTRNDRIRVWNGK